MPEEKKFRTIYITEPGKDFSKAIPMGAGIKYICNGYEDAAGRKENIREALKEFDPSVDAWIPVGRMLAVTEIALTIARKFPEAPVTIGIYKDGGYTWEKM